MELVEVTRFTHDVPAMTAFYEALLDRDPEFATDEIATFDVAGVTLLLHETYDAEGDDLPPEDHVSFAVTDLDGTVERLAGTLEMFREPTTYEWGRSAYLRDPDGRLAELTDSE